MKKINEVIMKPYRSIALFAFITLSLVCRGQYYYSGGFQGGGHGSGGFVSYVEEGIHVIGEESMISYPNPFHLESIIKIWLSNPEEVNLTVFDLNTRLVKSIAKRQTLPAGEHFFKWDGRNTDGQLMATGTYFYRLIISNRVYVRKILLL